ncbi:MAG: TrkH family potassium uptake protein [Proteobacteria bacterium]|nr:TrkH family potassium uptake protein [Pseudomonadota bacterium]MBU1390083.1 TrkH family potassium uptake protein [Pseudomonadota bacterium]MBU1544966.1 TrkH family potassium uptake protein [Pseudomonadota bacterium]MBU2429829.1 TrkH family potassium uptake protein [Pseudomonadota bacterium]MBU2482673.1 TrkH family potassium uptake protein [Pseudomonadota bacterium]
MRWNFMLRTVGILLLLLGVSMVIPLMVNYYYQEAAASSFFLPIIITNLTALLLILFTKKPKEDDYIYQKEGMATVAIAWTAISAFGALPFYFSPDFHAFTDAFFESVSGFTTTGSSVMLNIEQATKSLLFWRSLIQWMGGMGIIVLSLAVLPFLGVGGIQLYKAEVPSPSPDKLSPRLSDSAKILWMVYVLFTAVEIVVLWAGGMPLYESILHSFTTMPTGGFSPKNASIAHYNSAYFDYAILFFMVLAGINFSLHYQLIRGKTFAFWRDTECKFFLGLIIGITLIVTWDIYGSVYQSLEEAVRFASFQVVSILTTTGFSSADYEKFSGVSHVLLFICMFIGACAGSTGGGIKCSRIIVCIKYCYRELFKILHPRSIQQIKINNAIISNEIMRSIMAFLALYIGMFFLCSILLASLGVDILTALGAVASCIGNIGPGFGTVGPTENFAHLPLLGKWLLAWCMLLGRLEIYTVIILFVPEFWKK